MLGSYHEQKYVSCLLERLWKSFVGDTLPPDFYWHKCKVIAWYHTLHWYINTHDHTNRTLCEGKWLCKIRMLWCSWLRELAVHCIERGKVILIKKRTYYFENLYWIVSNINLFLHVLCSLVFHALCSYSILIIVHYFLYTGNIISCYFGYANPYFLRPYLPCMIYWSRGYQLLLDIQYAHSWHWCCINN